MKILKWIGISILILSVLLILATHIVEPIISKSPKRTEKFFEDQQVPYDLQHVMWNDRMLRVIKTGQTAADKIVLFCHGAPGSWGDFSSFMVHPNLLDRVTLISYDRPGYGGSGKEEPIPSITEQVSAAQAVIDYYNPSQVIVVGYSFGGPVAGVFAALNPTITKGLLLLAPVNDPNGEKIFWFNPLLNTTLAKMIFPPFLQSANQEKMNHAHVLTEVENQWSTIQCPVTHMHCKDDWIAPYVANTSFSESHIADSLLNVISWTGSNHFLPNTQMDRILPQLIELIGRME